jgi:hypothetical protein
MAEHRFSHSSSSSHNNRSSNSILWMEGDNKDSAMVERALYKINRLP